MEGKKIKKKSKDFLKEQEEEESEEVEEEGGGEDSSVDEEIDEKRPCKLLLFPFVTMFQLFHFHFVVICSLIRFSSICVCLLARSMIDLKGILLMDVDACFAAIEMYRFRSVLPQDSTPLVVSQWHSIIAVSYAARKFGIKRGMQTKECRALCAKNGNGEKLIVIHVETMQIGDENTSTISLAEKYEKQVRPFLSFLSFSFLSFPFFLSFFFFIHSRSHSRTTRIRISSSI